MNHRGRAYEARLGTVQSRRHEREKRRRSGTVAAGFGLVVAPGGNESWVGQRDLHPCRRAHNAECCSCTTANMRGGRRPIPNAWIGVHRLIGPWSLKNGTPPWCCPRHIWFWKPDCAAGARRVRAADRVASPAVITKDDAWKPRRRAAPPSAETSDASGETPRQRRSQPGAGPFFSRSGHAPAQSGKSKGPEALAPGPGMDKQRTNTVAGRYRCGHRRFAVDVSVFGAHLLRSPSSMKTGKVTDGTVAIMYPVNRHVIWHHSHCSWFL